MMAFYLLDISALLALLLILILLCSMNLGQVIFFLHFYAGFLILLTRFSCFLMIVIELTVGKEGQSFALKTDVLIMHFFE